MPGFSEVRLPVAGIAGHFGKGVKAYTHDDYQTAFKIFEPLAEKGEAGASYHMGKMYAEGLGLQRDSDMAKKMVS